MISYKTYLVIIACVFITQVSAQVGIGNTDPKATLDISASSVTAPSNTDGLLIPRIDDFPSTNPTSDQHGMMVYLTTTSGSNPPGFYYWDNNAGPADWTSVVGGTVAKIDDLSDGKSDSDGTNDGSSIFLGINAGSVDDSDDNQNVGIGFEALKSNTTGQGHVAFGYQSLYSQISGGFNTAIGQQSLFLSNGSHNTAIGNQTLFSNTSGEHNVAIGGSALYSNIDGRYNTAIGRSALSQNTTGSYNVATGSFSIPVNISGDGNTASGDKSLYSNTDGNYNSVFGYEAFKNNTTGDSNTIMGYNAMLNHAMGSFNVVLGQGAGYNNLVGESNVFLGSQAGYFETGGYKLYIENSSADADNALIYGEFDNNILRTNSEFQIGNPTGTGYAFPTNDGTIDQILQTDGSGQLSFVNPPIPTAIKIDDLSDGKSDSDGSEDGSSIFLGIGSGLNDDGTDNKNIGIGLNALNVITSGSNNTVLGYYAGWLQVGNNNTFIGTEAGRGAIPHNTSGSVFIGYRAGIYEMSNNTLIITNSNTDENNSLLYGKFDANILRTNGEFQIGNPTGTGYAFPTTSGTMGQVLQTDGSGSLSWVDTSTISTDDQNINGSGLSGTNLTIGIENGTNQVIDLSSLQDGTGTDNQNISSATLTGTTLAIAIESGTGATVDLSPLQDNDWHETGGTAPNDINDSVYTFGNVGIGTITPGFKLSVNGTANLNEGISSGTALRVNGAEALWYNGTYFSWGYEGTNFFINDVGIGPGTTLPAYKLDVRDDVTSNFVAQIVNTSTSINADGLLIKINAANPDTGNRFITFFSNTSTRGRIEGNGTGVSYVTTSDRRLKKNIVNISNSLELIEKIQPRKYEFKVAPGIEEFGFIAQELQPVYPQAVSGSPDSDVALNPMMVDYSRLTPLLTAGLQELNKKVEQLEDENKKLKSELEKYKDFEARLSVLEAESKLNID